MLDEPTFAAKVTMFAAAHRRPLGFTILELSVVMTVIALIIGGILIGASLIRNAELQSVISDVNRFRNAAKLFRDKYHYLPGDFPRAEEFWGALAGCPETAASSERTKSTCNGTGNGYLGSTASSPSSIIGTAQEVREPVRAWQHLANGGFIEGAYSGTAAPGTTGELVPGLNIPGGAIAGSGYTLHYASPYEEPFGAYPANYKHIIVIGCVQCRITIGGYLTVGSPAVRAILTPEEALWIDQKADDGKPGAGKVLSYTPAYINVARYCATTDDAASAQYNTGYKQKACPLIFITGL